MRAAMWRTEAMQVEGGKSGGNGMGVGKESQPRNDRRSETRPRGHRRGGRGAGTSQGTGGARGSTPGRLAPGAWHPTPEDLSAWQREPEREDMIRSGAIGASGGVVRWPILSVRDFAGAGRQGTVSNGGGEGISSLTDAPRGKQRERSGAICSPLRSARHCFCLCAKEEGHEGERMEKPPGNEGAVAPRGEAETDIYWIGEQRREAEESEPV